MWVAEIRIVAMYPSRGASKSTLLCNASITRHLSYLPQAASASTSQSTQQQEADNEAIRLRPLKSRQRWQWSKGDGPGEYGGPPLDFRIRKTWGKEIKDPLTSTDDYIWKTEWQKYLETPSLTDPSLPVAPQEKEPEVGFLSLNRATALDSIDVDLSKELAISSKSILELQVEAARQGVSIDEGIKQEKPRWRMAPTRREQKQWERARKATTGGTELFMKEVDKAKEDPQVVAAEAKERYLKLKNNIQLLTLVVGGGGTIGAYVSYSPEIAVSYGVGLLGSLAYIRMLGSSVDSFGNSVGQGALRGAIGQPRLLVPVVLVMLYNRWNEFLVPDFGFVHLDLIPILIGFFTYKVATLVEVFRDVLPSGNSE